MGLFGSAWLRLLTLAAVVAVSIVMAGTIGAALGYIVPRLVHRRKLDPTIASGPAGTDGRCGTVVLPGSIGCRFDVERTAA